METADLQNGVQLREAFEDGNNLVRCLQTFLRDLLGDSDGPLVALQGSLRGFVCSNFVRCVGC
jgi:hypothetical protein